MPSKVRPLPKPNRAELERLMRRAGIPHESYADKCRLAEALGVGEETMRCWFRDGRGPSWLHSWVNIYAKLTHQQRHNHTVEMASMRGQVSARSSAA